MEILSNIATLDQVPGPVHLAIGVFDGLHCGHQAVIRSAHQAAASCEDGGKVVVVTFDPHPISVIAPDRAPRLLTSQRHKMVLMARQGIETALIVKFDEAFSRQSGRAFVEQLQAAARPLRTICVGSEWSFGHRRSGNVNLLRELGEELGFTVVAVPTVAVGGTTASSTSIREAVTHGDFQVAAAMLGRPYTVLGTVVQGRKLGRELGFPTANLRVHNEQLPPSGVYAVTVQRLSTSAAENGSTPSAEEIAGVGNLGLRPTVDSGQDAKRQLEVHLFNFDSDIYGEDLEVRFVRFLRGERKFKDVDALRTQIGVDVEAAKKAVARLRH